MTNEATARLSEITDRLEEVRNSLTGLRNMSAKRQLVGLIDELDNLYNDFSEFELKIRSQEEIEQQLKERAIRNIIGEFERREARAYTFKSESSDLGEYHFYFNGELFLSDYLAKLTQKQEYPLKNDQLVNYIWFLIKNDVTLFQEGRNSCLDIQTGGKKYD